MGFQQRYRKKQRAPRHARSDELGGSEDVPESAKEAATLAEVTDLGVEPFISSAAEISQDKGNFDKQESAFEETGVEISAPSPELLESCDAAVTADALVLDYPYTSNGVYNDLVEDLNQCLEKLPEPTAPPLACPEDCSFLDETVVKEVENVPNIVKGPFLKDLIEKFDVSTDINDDILKYYQPMKEQDMQQFYFNDQLIAADQFLKGFPQELRPEEGELFQLLTEYIKMRGNSRELQNQVDNLKNEIKSCEKSLWAVRPDITLTEKGKCGDNNAVSFQHSYQQATLNEEVLNKFKTNLEDLVKLLVQELSPMSGILKYLKARVNVILGDLQKSGIRLISNMNGIQIQDSFTIDYLTKISKAVGTLFHFLRTIPVEDDKELIDELKSWLSDVIVGLVRAGAWQHQVLILSHVLRLPPDIASWAVPFVQCPPRNDDLAVTLLHTLMQPVTEKDSFVCEGTEEAWILVDAEGGDDFQVKETLLFQLFSQIPLKEAIGKFISTHVCTHQKVMTLLCFFTRIVKIVRCGLDTYYGDEYRNFAKRLGLLLRELVELATDQVEIYLAAMPFTPQLQVEYDAFVLETCRTFISTPSVWQFLAAVPLRWTSSSARWRLFLHLVQADAPVFSLSDFAPRFSRLSSADRCHILSALCHLASAFGSTSEKLTRAVVLHIFHVGFVCPDTSDSSEKDAKSLISALTDNNTFLISELIDVYNSFLHTKELDDDTSQLELWQAIQLNHWTPNPSDISILTLWLQKPPSTSRSQIARYILRQLNYQRISKRNQNNLARALVVDCQHAYSDYNFAQFTWTQLCRLRLHLADVGGSVESIPELEKDAKLGLLVSQNILAAVYLALQTTDVGASIPLIYENGFKLVRLLFFGTRYEAAYSCIDCLATLFWDCPDSLVSCQDFLSLLADIAAYGDSYYNVAKSLVSGQSSPIFSKFVVMLHSHFSRCDATKLNKAATLWMSVLTKLPLWQHSTAVVQLVDVVCRHCFLEPTAWCSVTTILEQTLSAPNVSEPRSPLATLWRFGNAPPAPSILPKNYNSTAPWFVYAAITVEFEVYEHKTGLWNNLLYALWENRNKKTNVDSTLKKVCGNLKIAARISSQLGFYRWASLATELPPEHPLNILAVGKLMGLYICRVPGIVDRGSVGGQFFHGVFNSGLLTRLKAKLDLLSETQTTLSETFKTIVSWLDSPVLLNPNLLVASLPAHYNAPLLHALLIGDMHPWLSLLPIREIRDSLNADSLAWSLALDRSKKTFSTPKRSAPDPPHQRITKILQNVVSPLPLTEPYLIETIDDRESLLKSSFFTHPTVQKVKTYLVERCKVLRKLSMDHKKAQALPESLYVGQVKKVVLKAQCSGFYKDGYTQNCSRPGSIVMSVREWQEDKGALQSFRTVLQQIENFSTDVPMAVVTSAVHIELTAKFLVYQLRNGQNVDPAVFFDMTYRLMSQASPTCLFLKKMLERCLLEVSKDCFYKTPAFTMRYILERQGSFLYDAFDPLQCNEEQFVDLYGKATERFSDSVFLAKFNITLWLKSARPKTQITSKLLMTIFACLQNEELRPAKNPSSHTVLNEQLQSLALYKFPEHFGEILTRLVVGKDGFSAETWCSFINVLAPAQISLQPNVNSKTVAIFISDFARQQHLLSLKILQHTCQLLSENFSEFRLAGILFSQYRQASESIIVFLGVIAQSLIVRLISENEGPSAQLVALAFSNIEKIFASWLVPRLGSPSPTPFEKEDARLAELAVTVFVDSLRFLGHSLSDFETVTSRTLNFYIKNFCYEKVDPFVLSVIHGSLSALSWNVFCPSLQDVEAILEVVNTYVPHCHSFLGTIYIQVNWPSVVNRSLTTHGNLINSSLHACLLHLLIKFPSEPSLKRNKAVSAIVEAANQFAWHLLDSSNYGAVVTWYTSSCEPNVVLHYPKSDYQELDHKILKLLQVAAGYDSNAKYFHPTTSTKRQMFVAGIAKCMATAASKRVPAEAIKKLIVALLDDIEKVLTATVQEVHRVNEAMVLMGEILRLLSEVCIATQIGDSLIAWLSETGGPLVVQALLQCCGRWIENPIFYGTIVEAAIESYFVHSGIPNWNRLICLMEQSRTEQIDQVLASNSCFLTLYTVLARRWMQQEGDIFYRLLQTFSTVKPTEISEPKLILLLGLALATTNNQAKAAGMLESLGDAALLLTNDRNSGFLSAIGLKKNPSPSFKMKLCCLAMAEGISNILRVQHNKLWEDKAAIAMEKAEASRQFGALQPCLMNVRSELVKISTQYDLLKLVYATAAQIYDKLYFIS